MALESGHTDVLGISLVHGNVVRLMPVSSQKHNPLCVHAALLRGMRWRPTTSPACVCRALTRLRRTWPASLRSPKGMLCVKRSLSDTCGMRPPGQHKHLAQLGRREDIPFYVGAGEPLLPLAEPMDAVFVRHPGTLHLHAEPPDCSPAANFGAHRCRVEACIAFHTRVTVVHRSCSSTGAMGWAMSPKRSHQQTASPCNLKTARSAPPAPCSCSHS